MREQVFIADNGVYRHKLQLSDACFGHQQPRACFHFHSCHYFQVLFPFLSLSLSLSSFSLSHSSKLTKIKRKIKLFSSPSGLNTIYYAFFGSAQSEQRESTWFFTISKQVSKQALSLWLIFFCYLKNKKIKNKRKIREREIFYV